MPLEFGINVPLLVKFPYTFTVDDAPSSVPSDIAKLFTVTVLFENTKVLVPVFVKC